MQIALVTSTPLSVRHGSGTHVTLRGLVMGLRNAGHQVRIIAPAGQATGFLTARRYLFNLLIDPDSVDDCDAVVGLDMDGFRLAGRTRQRLVHYALGVLADEAIHERGTARWALRLQSVGERRLYMRAHRILTTSAYSRQRLETLYGKPRQPIAIVPPPVDIDPFHDRRTAVRKKPQPFTVLTAAHMYPRKNIGAVLQAATQLQNLADIRFRIAGDGPERAGLERRARDLTNVRFLGHVSRNTLIDELQYAGAFCLPSLQEGFGIVLVEAMAAGTPVIALNSGSTPEIISHGVNGLLVDAKRIDTLTSAIERLYSDETLRTKMGEANRVKAREYSIEASTERFLRSILPDS